ncbi:DUF2178 domain-containing protein [Lysobacter sp. HA18]
MPMSFREKSQWVVLIALLLVYVPYFVRALPGHGADVAPSDVARFVGAVIAMVLLQVVGHVMLTVANRRDLAHGVQRDERDRLIDQRAGRIALHVLSVGVFATLCAALLVRGNFVVVHVLFGFWVLSQAVELTTRIALYRRGA